MKKIKIISLIILSFLILIWPVNWENSNTGFLEAIPPTQESPLTEEKVEQKKEKKDIKKINENNINKEIIKKEKTLKELEKEKKITLEELEKEIVWSWTLVEIEKIQKVEKKEDNIIIDAYKTRRQQVFDLIKKSPEEQKIDNTDEILEYIKAEKKINQKNYEKLQEDIQTFNNLKQELKNKEEEIKRLENTKNKTEEQIKKLQKEKELNVKDRIKIRNKQREIEREIERKKLH